MTPEARLLAFLARLERENRALLALLRAGLALREAEARLTWDRRRRARQRPELSDAAPRRLVV